jgi:hypothetical protein
MFGAHRSIENSRIVASTPARKLVIQLCCGRRHVVRRRRCSPSVPRSDRWMWHDDPSRSSYLAMKVSDLPWRAAISLATVL